MTVPPASVSDASPALSHPSPLLPRRTFERTQSQQLATALDVDLSLPTAISHLVEHLLQPILSQYPSTTIQALRHELSTRLTELFSPTWEEPHPQVGSGYRSLICSNRLGLPLVLRESARQAGVGPNDWKKALSSGKGRNDDEEWEAWCDPGAVVWRYGGWEWEDVGFEPFKVIREPFQVIWRGGASDTAPPSNPQQVPTPVRPSHAIPIRAPTVFAIPPTPAPPSSHVIFPSSPLRDSDSSRPSSPVHYPTPGDSDNLPSAFTMQSELGLGPAPFFHRSTSPSFSDASHLSSAFLQSAQNRSISDSSVESADSQDALSHNFIRSAPSRGSHRGSESLSSVASSASESNSGHTQLLTPASRPGSADPFNVNVPPLSMRDTQREQSDKDKEKEKEREREMVRMRKITPPMLALRGRTPSPHTPDQSTATPGTETTITPNSALPPTPSVTPYDGGNVTVLGGGVKLGGAGGAGSRSVSAMSHRSTSGGNGGHGMDRSRSPSVSLASRALSTALGPNSENGTGEATTTRKQRTRRRIMPTYLGHLGQPGVGGPIMGVFSQFQGKPQQLPPPPPPGVFVPHVGVGMAPPPATSMGGAGMANSLGMKPVSLGMQRMA